MNSRTDQGILVMGATMNKWGHEERVWDLALAECIKILASRAAQRGNQAISYSELAGQIKSIPFNAEDTSFYELLGQVSIAECEAGRGMLSALVVHKTGEQMPGPGFFRLAEELGNDVRDKEKFWVEELNRVLKVHRGKDTRL